MVLVVFGVAKSIASFRGSAVVSNVFDVMLGVVWGVMYVYPLLFSASIMNLMVPYRALWMSTMEAESNTTWAWFFQVNRKKEVFHALKEFLLCISALLYICR